MKPLRKCKDCGLEAHDEAGLELFTKDIRSKHGRKLICLSCGAIYTNLNRKPMTTEDLQDRKIYDAKYYCSNKERIAKVKQTYRENNQDKINNLCAKRRALKLSQTPDLTKAQTQRIKDKYELSTYLTTLTGEDYHVDHIIPLSKGGLHHPDNLRVIPATANLTKGSSINFQLTKANVDAHYDFYGQTLECINFHVSSF